jgi:uncharacterized cupin superfamily protein
MGSRMLSPDVLAHALTPEPPEADDVVRGPVEIGSAELADLGSVSVGLWQITEGQVRDVEADEVFVVLQGRGTVTFDDGSVLELRPGVAARLREGERTVWSIEQTLRKIYVLPAVGLLQEEEQA